MTTTDAGFCPAWEAAMVRRQTARVQAMTVEQVATVDTAPRAVRGIMLAAALSLPMWGGIGLIVHGLWSLMH
jgi:hypothetical protein